MSHFVLPEHPSPITLYQCQKCKYFSTQRCNVQIHQGRAQACREAGIVIGRVMIQQGRTAIAADGSSTRTTGTTTATTNGTTTGTNGTTNGTTSINVIGDHNTIINVNLQQQPRQHVVPAMTDEEAEAIVDTLLENQEVLADIFSPDDLSSIVATMFQHTKGHKGPPHLQNVRLEGQTVCEMQQDGAKRFPPKQYVKVQLPRFLQLLEHIILYGMGRVPRFQSAADRIAHALFTKKVPGAKNRAYTCLTAAELYTDRNGEFHKLVPGEMKTLVLDMVQRVLQDAIPPLKRAKTAPAAPAATFT